MFVYTLLKFPLINLEYSRSFQDIQEYKTRPDFPHFASYSEDLLPELFNLVECLI